MRPSVLSDVWRSQGVLGTVQSAKDRLVGTRSALADEALIIAEGVKGIEIGGPSGRFGRHGMLPIYSVMRAIDNVNFSDQTLWEGSLVEGMPFAPTGTPVGIQFLREATDLSGIADHSYDLILSSHCLEHIANPLRALREWRRICGLEGYLCLIVPHRDGTFDRNRPVTPMNHYMSDEQNNVDETDDTHFDEIIRLHDLRRDPGVRSLSDLKSRVAQNQTMRAVHHHVFDLKSAVLLISEAGWTPFAAEARRPYDILILAKNFARSPAKCDPGSIVKGSPFKSDR